MDKSTHSFKDIVEVTNVDDGKKFLLVRQFKGYEKLIIKVITTGDTITEIRITAFAPYIDTNFKGMAFRFPSVSDYYEFAKGADKKVAEYLQPLIDGKLNVTDQDVVNSLLHYFDNPDMPLLGTFNTWERSTHYIHQLGVKIDRYSNVKWLKYGQFEPIYGTLVKLDVEYDVDMLLGFNIFIDKPNSENDPRYRIEERIVLCDAHAAVDLQHALSTKAGDVYDSLVARFAPFDEKNVAAFKRYLDGHKIAYIDDIRHRPVKPKTLFYTIPVYQDRNVPESNGYVPHGTSRDMHIIISYFDQMITKIEFEDKTVTSGYWHDNPNYPYSDISSKNIVIDDAEQIHRFVDTFGSPGMSPQDLMEKMKERFQTQTDFVAYLDAYGIPYTVKE